MIHKLQIADRTWSEILTNTHDNTNAGYNDQLRLRDEVLDSRVNLNPPPDQVSWDEKGVVVLVCQCDLMQVGRERESALCSHTQIHTHAN